MKNHKDKIIKISLIFISILVVFSLYLFKSKREKNNREFFVETCVETIGNNSFILNDVFDDFIKELPEETSDFIGREYGFEYTSFIEPNTIKIFCSSLYDHYKEKQDLKYDICDNYRCTI